MQVAIDTADELATSLTSDVLELMADWIEPFYPMKQHVPIRFGKWDEIKAQPLPDDPNLYAMTTALIHYAKTVACAATGDIPGAEAARDDFRAAKAAVPETRMLFNNTCADILGVAEAMLEGELSYRKR